MDFSSPKGVIDAVVKRAEHGIYGYCLAPESYYDSIISWMKKRHSWDVAREWIINTVGVIPSINIAIQAFTQPGDKVICQTPVYYPFYNIVRNNGCHFLANSLEFVDGKYLMDFEDLKRKAADPRAKAMILCSPHNPVGRVWTKEELAEVSRICLENDVFIISDEIHCDLVYKNHRHIPLALVSEDIANNSIICISASKSFNLAGLKTSSVVIPNKRIRQKFEHRLESVLVKSPNVFGCVAAEEAYNHGEDWLEQVLGYIESNLEFLTTYIQEKIPQIKVIQPEGTYFVWLDCRGLGMEYQDLEEFMLNKVKVWFDEGSIFGEEGQGFQRIVIACPRKTLEEVLNRLERSVSACEKHMERKENHR